MQKQLVIYVLGGVYIVLTLIFVTVTVIVVKQDSLIRKGNPIIIAFFKVAGHIFIIINYVLYLPSMTIFAEVARCYHDSIPEEKIDYYFTCLNSQHQASMIVTIFGGLCCLIIVIYTNLFVNSQFPDEYIPQACWNPKARVIFAVFKIVYIFHYDVLDPRYIIALRFVTFFLLIYKMMIFQEQPRIYNHFVDNYEIVALSVTLSTNFIIILQDIFSEIVLFEILPFVILGTILLSGVLIVSQSRRNTEIFSTDSRILSNFKSEVDMEIYIILLLEELVFLKNLSKGTDYSSSPKIFTIISKHMENCRQEECICKKYEPEFDKKFSSIGSRRLTMRQSSSFSSVDYMFKKKIPIKITYETKVQIFLAEISDCIDRFLEVHPRAVGLKLLKSFFHHAYMNSSYKALFVQLENSHLCNSFRGKINIYHLKTKIQQEMTQSEASPFSIDINTCLKFEAKRVIFEQEIIQLCMVCEQFWNELIQSEKEYKVEKIHMLLLSISKTVISIKEIYNQLCHYNPQNVDVIQNYALVYRYILRDEFRFNDIIGNLNQLKKTNKLEQIRELVPKFFDSDNYAMILVSGDVKDLGKIIKANRGVEFIFGYTSHELQNAKINKIMPKPFAKVHDDFLNNFLQRGHSNFIDRNQFLLVENKLRFIQMTLAYVKAMVDLHQGLIFASFFKIPVKVPNNAEGNHYIKAKEAHYILCDSKGQIQGMSYNCMKNLGIPPTIIAKSQENTFGLSILEGSVLTSIDKFAPNILGPEYEFDLPKGMNFTFDTTAYKNDKHIAKEFQELTTRMRKYNIFVTLKKYEYRISSQNIVEIMLFTIEILSFQLSEAPITIPVDKTEDQSYSQYSGTTASSANNDEMRTTKFKEFKTQVQELKEPSKISLLKKITIAFFLFLLAVFSLNYALCATQNYSYMSRVQILDILFELTNKIPSTSRYVRTCVDIANGFESNSNEVIPDRFSYYMSRIKQNAEIFRELQQEIYTSYSNELSLNDLKLQIKDLQTDYSVKSIESTISSALNMFSSKALQFSNNKLEELRNVAIPLLSLNFNYTDNLTDTQQDLFFILQNGHESIPKALNQLKKLSQDRINSQSETFMLVSLIIAIVSILVNFIIIPIVFPLLIHYERLAFYLLHSFNKLTKKFVENEIKCCNQLFSYIGKKQIQMSQKEGMNDKKAGQMMKKPEGRKENKQLMKVNPKIPKHVIEQQKKQKAQRRQSHFQEEQKAARFEGDKTVTYAQQDEGSALLDEQLDEDQSFARQGSYVPNHRNQMQRKSILVNRDGRRDSLVQGGRNQVSIDESTIQTSIEMNSSTSNSSSDTSSDSDEEVFTDQSSQSNYTQYTNASHWRAMKQNGFSASRIGALKSNAVSFIYDITHAKSSELAGEQAEGEENELKRIVKDRQEKIKASLKKRKVKKVLQLIVFVILISVYLGVNAMYTRFVFEYEEHLQNDIDIIDRRILCYPYSLTLLKEMIARNQSISMQFYDEDRIKQDHSSRLFLTICYENEKEFYSTVLGQRLVNGQAVLSDEFKDIEQSLQKNKLCDTLYMSDQAQKHEQCANAYNGISNLGLSELLNYILRESEKIIYSYETAIALKEPVDNLINILHNSTLNKLETVKDTFIDDAFEYQREKMITEIKAFARQLFQIFDILFSVFVTICFMLVSIGVIIIIRKLKSLIIQIYHIVLLIPYGERTKKELNELLKISL